MQILESQTYAAVMERSLGNESAQFLLSIRNCIHCCAAYETTANSLAFTLYMLARPENKSKVERLTTEVDTFGRSRVPTFEDLDQFPWLEVRPDPRPLYVASDAAEWDVVIWHQE